MHFPPLSTPWCVRPAQADPPQQSEQAKIKQTRCAVFVRRPLQYAVRVLTRAGRPPGREPVTAERDSGHHRHPAHLLIQHEGVCRIRL